MSSKNRNSARTCSMKFSDSGTSRRPSRFVVVEPRVLATTDLHVTEEGVRLDRSVPLPLGLSRTNAEPIVVVQAIGSTSTLSR